MHFRYTPIHYGAKGEVQHKRIDDIYSKEDALASQAPEQCGAQHMQRCDRIIESLVKCGANAAMISETHNSQDKGALAMLAQYKSLVGSQIQ